METESDGMDGKKEHEGSESITEEYNQGNKKEKEDLDSATEETDRDINHGLDENKDNTDSTMIQKNKQKESNENIGSGGKNQNDQDGITDEILHDVTDLESNEGIGGIEEGKEQDDEILLEENSTIENIENIKDSREDTDIDIEQDDIEAPTIQQEDTEIEDNEDTQIRIKDGENRNG